MRIVSPLFWIACGIVCLLCTTTTLKAQPQLAGSIGLSSMPDDNEGVCVFPRYNIKSPYDLDQYGMPAGRLIPDFTLYTRDSVAVTASTVLGTGKPLILICGSYTCDIFRNAIPQINQIYTNYSDKTSIYLVYTVEAHPIVDTNMYKNAVWVVPQDSTDNVLYRQPKTYGERKALIDTMLCRQTSPAIKPPIIIDGPCNNWWRTFGPAPNCAYVIGANGYVKYHQAWFNGDPGRPDFLAPHIDTLLGLLKHDGVDGIESSSKVSVWPSPVAQGGALHIAGGSNASSHLALYDLLGRQVFAQEVMGDATVLLAGVMPGTYMYRLDGDRIHTGRIIVTP